MIFNLKNFLKFSFVSALTITAVSCSNDDSNGGGGGSSNSAYRPYHLVLGQSSTGSSKTYTQGITVEDMMDSNKTFSFTNYGFEVPSTRTARVYTSDDGRTLYNLNYGGGDIAKYNYASGQDYSRELNTDVQAVMGTANPRWTKINSQYAVLQAVAPENLYQDASQTVYQRTKSTIRLALVDLNTMTVIQNSMFEYPYDLTEATEGIYVSRIDAPVEANGKLYYGVMKRKYDPLTASNGTVVYDKVETLVVDYPSLENPSIITNTNAAGSSNGYRTPVAHKDENSDTYQLVTSGDATILKISNGAYDTSYSFNISSLLPFNAEANTGWFYVGNGIGYVPVLNTDNGNSASSNWHLIRVDVYNKTAVQMNIPFNMWLRMYQWASVIDGKLFMALTPLGGDGNIYIFDPANDSANGYSVGASLQTGADAFYLGIF
ncbi:MAG: hypothetical protein ACK5MD_01290 [Flavobacteriales bacterium]